MHRSRAPDYHQPVSNASPAVDEEIHDSPVGNVALHIREYLATGGRVGHVHRGRRTLLLTTRGRRTGKARRTALIYGRHGESYVLVASHAGAPRHPAWYLNLVAHPEVQVQVGAERFTGVARTADPDERAALWPLMVAEFHMFDRYQVKAGDRQIPIAILEPKRS